MRAAAAGRGRAVSRAARLSLRMRFRRAAASLSRGFWSPQGNTAQAGLAPRRIGVRNKPQAMGRGRLDYSMANTGVFYEWGQALSRPTTIRSFRTQAWTENRSGGSLPGSVTRLSWVLAMGVFTVPGTEVQGFHDDCVGQAVRSSNV